MRLEMWLLLSACSVEGVGGSSAWQVAPRHRQGCGACSSAFLCAWRLQFPGEECVQQKNAGCGQAGWRKVVSPACGRPLLHRAGTHMPPHVVRTFSRRSLCRATCLLAGSAASHELRGNKPPMPELADVAAYK
eukprot:1158157-Pelagomonas_calceolata.AAC.10